MGYSPWGHKESDTTEQLRKLISTSILDPQNGTLFRNRLLADVTS